MDAVTHINSTIAETGNHISQTPHMDKIQSLKNELEKELKSYLDNHPYIHDAKILGTGRTGLNLIFGDKAVFNLLS